ncbi:MAG: hypothetical protein OXR68_05620 [Alphaproteobacteria bacterium]|nr:hypothetical protein [Alphaproteobacteria bacterium]
MTSVSKDTKRKLSKEDVFVLLLAIAVFVGAILLSKPILIIASCGIAFTAITRKFDVNESFILVGISGLSLILALIQVKNGHTYEIGTQGLIWVGAVLYALQIQNYLSGS